MVAVALVVVVGIVMVLAAGAARAAMADYRYVRRERNSFDPFLLTYVPPDLPEDLGRATLKAKTPVDLLELHVSGGGVPVDGWGSFRDAPVTMAKGDAVHATLTGKSSGLLRVTASWIGIDGGHHQDVLTVEV